MKINSFTIKIILNQMVEQYHQRLEEARVELAMTIRENLRHLMDSGHLGIIYLGGRYAHDERGLVDIGYKLSDGHLVECSSWESQGLSLPRWAFNSDPIVHEKKREIAPYEIPLESYQVEHLLRIATDIEKSQRLSPSVR